MDPRELLSLLGYQGDPTSPPPEMGLADPFAPPTAPAQPGIADPFPAPPTPQPQPETVQAGASVAGFSPQKFQQVQKATAPGDKGLAGIRQRAEERFAPLQQGYEQALGEEQTAVDALSTAEQDKIRIKAEHSAKLATQQADFQREEELAWADANAAAEAAMQEYNAKLLEIPMLNPSQLWDSAGNVGQFGMAAAAFLHDFLGAKGIKTSAMDTMKAAIDRNIDGQIANINNKRQTAQGFKDLWEMTRAQSQSDAEARTRMRGFALASLQAELDAQLGSYDSTLAAAKHQLAKAQLAKEQQKNLMDVRKAIEDAAATEASQYITMRGQNLTAAQHEASMRLQRDLAALKNKDAKELPVIYDLTKSGKGAAKFRFKPAYADDKELIRDVTKKAISTTQAIEGMRELRDLQAKMGSSSPDMLGRLRDELERKEKTLRSRVVMALVLEQSGRQVTDKEREYIEALVPADDWFTNGKNVAIISQLLAAKGKELNDTLKTYTNDIVEGDPAFGTSAAQGTFGEGELVEAEIMKDQAPKTTTKQDTVEKQLGSPTAFEAAKEVDSVARADWDAYRQASGISDDSITRARKQGGARLANIVATGIPDNTFMTIHELANLVIKGDAEAAQALDAIANQQAPEIPHAPGTNPKKLTAAQAMAREYALWEKARLAQFGK